MTLFNRPIEASQFGVWAEAGAQKLPPPTRAAVIMALLGIVLVGLLIVAIILLGGHWVRRQGGHRRQVVPPDREPLRRLGQRQSSASEAADASSEPNSGEPLT